MKLPLASITVYKRRREDYGDIKGLAESIKTYGLLHPIVVDGEGTLVAGERRLRAVEMLGWESVDVRDIGDLTDAERNEIELEENRRRKDLTPFEESRDLVSDAKKVAPIISAKLAEKDPRGRKSKHDAPRSDVAQALGTSESSLRRAEQHVAAAERYPELQAPEVPQRAAIEIAKSLDTLPEPEREQRREILRTEGPRALTLSEGETFPTGKLTDEQKAFYDASKTLLRLAKWKHVDPVAVADAAPVETVHPTVVQLSKVVEWVTRVHSALRAREERPTLRAVKG